MLFLAGLLAGCVSKPVQPQAPVDSAQARVNDAQRTAITAWRLSGRVAVSNGSQGGSGRLDWRQHDDRYEISLSAPVTRQGWRLIGDNAGARLEGIKDGPRESTDVEQLLLTETGWDIPVRALVAWVRGVGATEGIAAPARVVYGNGNVPSVIEQMGWRIDYRDWHPAKDAHPALPKRIEAERDAAKVRLIVDEWTVEAMAASEPVVDTPEVQLQRTLQTLNLEDPAADVRAAVESGDKRPVGVCGFACLALGHGEGSASVGYSDMRIIDGSGDVVMGEHHLALKQQAEAYARAYNLALGEWLRSQSGSDTSRASGE